ncbi:hypothetical protein FHS55_001019 [Angulomicrobium tetraedrale]|uniref:Uncharacterized protein n=1 Tax=Ancylobacter tetraedralis TaxID=217068 RepID=A0A839Z5Y3_9HYPH|nr:hypothetical protein [Ancylobacter tetraedralis]MBB3770433.1 hypothetical protein [Ancylobacter tetraedralis]
MSMRLTPVLLTLVMAVLAIVGVAVEARVSTLAANPGPPSPAFAPGDAPGDFRPGPPFGPPPGFAPPPGGPLVLAGHLAAMETYLGITRDQLDGWRAYTEALQAMMALPLPALPTGMAEAKASGDTRPDTPPPGAMPPGDVAFGAMPPEVLSSAVGGSDLPGERLAQELVRKGEQATRLAAAIGVLRAELSPEQIGRLQAAAWMPGPPPGAIRGATPLLPAPPRPEEPEPDHIPPR